MKTVLHLVHGAFCSLLPDAEDGIGFVEEQDRDCSARIHGLAVLVEDLLNILFAFAHPAAFNLGHIDDEKIAATLTCNLVDGFCLTGPGGAVKQAVEACPKILGFHLRTDIVETFVAHQLF